MTLSGTALFIGAEAVMGIFTPDRSVVLLGASVLRMVAVTEPVYGVSVILEGIFQGVGDTKYCFIYNLLGMWGIRILGTWIMLNIFGMDASAQSGLIAAWGCMIAHNLVVGALLAVRYLRGKWNPLNRANPQAMEA